jgi:hypothetical protein
MLAVNPSVGFLAARFVRRINCAVRHYLPPGSGKTISVTLQVRQAPAPQGATP